MFWVLAVDGFELRSDGIVSLTSTTDTVNCGGVGFYLTEDCLSGDLGLLGIRLAVPILGLFSFVSFTGCIAILISGWFLAKKPYKCCKMSPQIRSHADAKSCLNSMSW